MRKYEGKIFFIVILLVCFIAIYTVADAQDNEIKFGYWVNLEENEEMNFVILGTDKDETRTDLILLCHLSEEDNKLNVMQIPRDTKVDTERSDKKINSAYGSKEKINTVKSEIEKITGVYPENYIVLNFQGFRELIDAIGGVEYAVPVNMQYSDPVQNLNINLKKGLQVLDGEKAEMFMRFRQNNDGSGYVDGDIGRLKAQKSFYEATIRKLLSFDGILNLGGVMDAVGNNLKTDFTLTDLMNHIGDIKNLSEESINIFVLPGRGEYLEQNGILISYYITDKEALEKLINSYF